MTRRDWWLGVTAIVLAVFVHAAVPRYQWQHMAGAAYLRVDRWTGNAVLGTFRAGIFDEVARSGIARPH
jgi:hypothetical protein